MQVPCLLERVWAVGGFAGPPTDDEARLLAKQQSAAGLSNEEWEDGLQPIWWEQCLQMDEMWRAEENVIAIPRSACRSDVALARGVLVQWRAARLAAHHAAAWYGRDKLVLVEIALSKADIEAAKRAARRGRPWPFVLFDGARPAFVSPALYDWAEDNDELVGRAGEVAVSWSVPLPAIND